ncbi:hypothetical protein K458DRAFT_382872 [Lentithecium fluviatile CBS 122367]|uniref:G-patch domain-containing protein n=1 Tax=Lentithecium fluviatile CBS 122367 TaxID=1168545 RepID=A0A6G1JMF8_9PLEO|nr:hypothetical protein K458DRAFT_382872 [Lentithecium fluviatile CBS 122367]
MELQHSFPTATMTALGKPYPEDSANELPEDSRYDDADISTAPFVEHRAFGRGLWKRPIKFVPAAPASPPNPSPSKVDGASIARMYLAIVFPNGRPQPKHDDSPVCEVCKAPVKGDTEIAHYLSPVHQAALPRAPIPSGIDRTRMGLKYLEKHGFDVDARVGLGTSGQGRLFPIMLKEKRDKLGLGVDQEQVVREKKEGLVPKPVKLDAGKVRKLAAVQKKKHENLQRMFYGDDKLERYLGRMCDIDHGLK